MNEKMELKNEFMFGMDIILAPPYSITEGRVVHAVAPASLGEVVGPKLKGTVVHGGDWGIRQKDGSVRTDVRVVIKTDDEAYIYLYYSGILYMQEDNQIYVRTNAIFEASGKYEWLNRVFAIGIGSNFDPKAGKLHYDFYQVF